MQSPDWPDGLMLAIESSCDETSAAVVRGGRRVLSVQTASQIQAHERYGGVVPEIASRMHMEAIDLLVRQAVEQAGVHLQDLGALAVTQGPGLVGALLVGVSHAKAMAWALGKPLVAVHHMEGHIAANYIASPDLAPPFLCLVVSGGHTQLVDVVETCTFRILGTTRDDAAGEAFDKGARILGLGYPGGAQLSRLAAGGRADRFDFPRARLKDSLDFSYSGVKTALRQFVGREGEAFVAGNLQDLAAAYQQAILDPLVEKTVAAQRRTGREVVAIGGGVAANPRLRQCLRQALPGDVALLCPPPELCGDNAAMIAAAGWLRFARGEQSGLDLNASPGLPWRIEPTEGGKCHEALSRL